MVPAPERSVVSTTFGYHPLATDLAEMVRETRFDELLVLGPSVPDVVDHVGAIKCVREPGDQLPSGIYWFSGVSPSALMVVQRGLPETGPASVVHSEVTDDSPLGRALSWFEHLWDSAVEVPQPAFNVAQDVLVRSTGHDGVIKARSYSQARWTYVVFAAGKTQRFHQQALEPRPTVDDPMSWVTKPPVSPERFAATLTRAKLDGDFTDTVFSFRATRTLFRPYQFKPVLKLLQTGSLRLLVADEVGLGKTIEAGLLWTELEARKRADRVLVVCPSSLVGKWQREMEERFGFEVTELTREGMDALMARLEAGIFPRRASFVCSIERMRAWEDLDRSSDLGLQWDLVVVDEAHAFRNSDTKSHALGEHLSQWAEALVMLSATPVNLRNSDLFNLLELLVPGEFGDLPALEARIAPNEVLHRITGSLFDRTVTAAQRIEWLGALRDEPYGQVLVARPEFRLLRQTLARSPMTKNDVVSVKRLCAELHGLSAQVTRTRKLDIQENKPMREPRMYDVNWSTEERDFYDAYYQWCVERAEHVGMPLYFSMQMPLRLAGSCLPEAARSVLEWSGGLEVEGEEQETTPPQLSGSSVPPSSDLMKLAESLACDTKYDVFRRAIRELVAQGKRSLVFTFSRRTLAYLERRLAGEARIAVLHGDLDRRSRDRIMSEFRSGAYDVLIATRVASEGLDFEFCSAVVNYDIPWNPMEVEQRIGRIDRIGQQESKLAIVNFHTPGTIETDIVERVLLRIKVFERAIGALEPILESQWHVLQKAMFDFQLTPEQRRLQEELTIAALEEQARTLGDVESAAPQLISSDGVDIEGLETDLVSSGRYVGQQELALLVKDWVATYGGKVEISDNVLRLEGNAELAKHVQMLVSTGERLSREVGDLLTDLRAEQPIVVALDQELSRVSGLSLLTATHPLTRAAVLTPGYRLGRYAQVSMTTSQASLPPGPYLVQLVAAHWRGIRTSREVWSAAVDLRSGALVDSQLGDALLAQLAQGSLRSASHHENHDLEGAIATTTMDLDDRRFTRDQSLQAENGAFLQTRRISLTEVHERRVETIQKRIATLEERGRHRMIPLQQAQLRREQQRYRASLAELEVRSAASLSTEDLAVCLVDVTPGGP